MQKSSEVDELSGNGISRSFSNIELNSDSGKYLRQYFEGSAARDILDVNETEEPRRTLSLTKVPGSIVANNEKKIPAFNKHRPQRKLSFQEESKRHQSKLLLVSLLENFCLLYDESPERNHKLFLVICKMLSSMGILDKEYIDELSGVRQSYIKAFKELVFQASQAVEQEKSLKLEKRSLSLQYFPTVKDSPSDNQTRSCSVLKPIKNQIRNLDDLLYLHESRYRTDFEEGKVLGMGGFGSVWMAKNKLNGIWYAVKKIRLKNEFNYERILREIKNLARLDHHNIVRYYSSWLEHINYPKCDSLSLYDSTSSIPSSTSNSYLPNNETNSTPKHDYTNHKGLSSCDSKGDDSFFSTECDRIVSKNCFLSKDSIDDFKSSKNNILKSDKTFFKNEQTSMSEIATNSCLSGSDIQLEFTDSCENVDQISDCSAISLNRNNSILSPSGLPNQQTIQDSFAVPQRQLTLFIQMQLCGSTLKDFIDWRNTGVSTSNIKESILKNDDILEVTSEPIFLPIDPSANFRLFRAIVEGVNYIHQSGLIHRDLKPANIFLSLSQDKPDLPTYPIKRYASDFSTTSENTQILSDTFDSCNYFQDSDSLVPKIGDFGLATSFTESEPIRDGSENGFSRTYQVGTFTYASPEQLSDPPISYNEKSDIYSLGIIFFELFYPFSTGMERIKVLQELREGVLPKDFVSKWPKEAAFVLWLTAENPSLRPSAKEILDFEPFKSQSNKMDQSSSKDDIIIQLKKENQELSDNVRNLKRKIDLLQLALQNKQHG